MALSHSEAAECATREPTHASALFPAAATTSHSAHHALQGLRIDASHAATAPTHAAKRVASASHAAKWIAPASASAWTALLLLLLLLSWLRLRCHWCRQHAESQHTIRGQIREDLLEDIGKLDAVAQRL